MKTAVIVILVLIALATLRYCNSKAIDEQNIEFKHRQQKSIDSISKITNSLREALIIEQDKPPVIIPKYYEKIIYKSVNDAAIISAFTTERENYIKKQKRLGN